MLKLCFSTLCCPEWGFDEIFASAKDLGYKGVEIRGVKEEIYAPKIAEFSDENLQKTIQKLKSLNIEIPVLTSGADFSDKKNINKHYKEAQDYIKLASALGVKYVRVLADKELMPTFAVDVNFIADNLKKICKEAALSGVSILIETNGYFSNSKNLLDLIKKVKEKNLFVIWDVHHPYRFMKENIADTYNVLKKYIKHVHIKDSHFKNNKIKYELIGDGDVPVKSVVKLLDENKFKGFVSLEWVRRWSKDLAEAGIVLPQYIYTVKAYL